MATVFKAHTSTQISCRCVRPRAYCVVPKATSAVSTKQSTNRIAVTDSALRQRTGYSYVKWNASAADFANVLARLEAATFLSPEARSAIAVTAPEHAAPQRKPWASAIIGGLFGGSKHHEVDMSDTSLSQEDGPPLSHAVVMFTATWCGPCSVVYRQLKLAADRLQGRPPSAILVVDVEEEKELASQLGIKALPTLLYLSSDESRGPIFTQGPVSASVILDALDRSVGFGGRNMKAKWLKL